MSKYARQRNRSLTITGQAFVSAAALVMVSAVDPYSGNLASAQTIQVTTESEFASQQLEIRVVGETDFQRAGFEILTGAKVTALFVADAPYPREGAKAYALEQVTAQGWNYNEYSCLVKLWERESNWRHTAENKSSGAYGIPQSLPASKMASAGPDWRTNPETQIRWGISYIKGRYKVPCAALAHSDKHNWY
jgi:hypothetical protein